MVQKKMTTKNTKEINLVKSMYIEKKKILQTKKATKKFKLLYKNQINEEKTKNNDFNKITKSMKKQGNKNN